MNQPWIYMCSPSRSPLPPLSPSHPSGSFVFGFLVIEATLGFEFQAASPLVSLHLPLHSSSLVPPHLSHSSFSASCKEKDGGEESFDLRSRDSSFLSQNRVQWTVGWFVFIIAFFGFHVINACCFHSEGN